MNRAAERGDLDFTPVLPGYEIKRSSTQFVGGNVEKEWVTQHKTSGAAFQMPAGQILKGASAFIDAEGRIRHQWIKTKNNAVTPALIAALEAEFAAYRGRAQLVPAPRRVERDMLSVYPIADPTPGKGPKLTR